MNVCKTNGRFSPSLISLPVCFKSRFRQSFCEVVSVLLIRRTFEYLEPPTRIADFIIHKLVEEMQFDTEIFGPGGDALVVG